MINRKIFLIKGLILFTSTGFHLSAQDVTNFTLDEVKAYALEHHIDIRNASRDIDIARQQIVETRGMGLPQVNLNGSFSNFLNLPVQVVNASFINPAAPPDETISFKAGTDYSASGTVQVDQLLFNGSYIVGLQVSSYFANFQETAAQITSEEVVFNAIQAYQLAVIAKANKAFADSIVTLTQKMVDQQQHYFDLGLMLQEDLDQLSYSLLAAKNSAINAEVQYQNAISYLKLAIGYPMGGKIDISETPDQLIGRSEISAGDVHNNLQYELMNKKITLSEYGVKNNRFANLPSVNAYFQHTYNAYRNEFNFFADESWFPQTVWGIQLNVPIFSGFQRRARTAQSKIALMKDESALEQLEETLKFQEIQVQNQLLGAKASYALQEENIALATAIYSNAITKESIGKGNSIIVTQKHNQLMVAQAQYLGSMVDLLQAQLNLDKLYNNIISNQ